MSSDPESVATILKERIKDAGFKHITIKKRDRIGDIVGEHYEIIVNKETVVFLYKPTGCLSYNIIKQNGRERCENGMA